MSWFWSFDTAFSCVFLYFGVCYVLLFKVNILVSYVLVPSSFRFQLCVCPLCPSLCFCVSLCLVSLFCFYVLFLVFHSPPPSPSPSQVCFPLSRYLPHTWLCAVFVGLASYVLYSPFVEFWAYFCIHESAFGSSPACFTQQLMAEANMTPLMFAEYWCVSRTSLSV